MDTISTPVVPGDAVAENGEPKPKMEKELWKESNLEEFAEIPLVELLCNVINKTLPLAILFMFPFSVKVCY
jgi:hypothetical protein